MGGIFGPAGQKGDSGCHRGKNCPRLGLMQFTPGFPCAGQGSQWFIDCQCPAVPLTEEVTGKGRDYTSLKLWAHLATAYLLPKASSPGP